MSVIINIQMTVVEVVEALPTAVLYGICARESNNPPVRHSRENPPEADTRESTTTKNKETGNRKPESGEI